MCGDASSASGAADGEASTSSSSFHAASSTTAAATAAPDLLFWALGVRVPTNLPIPEHLEWAYPVLFFLFYLSVPRPLSWNGRHWKRLNKRNNKNLQKVSSSAIPRLQESWEESRAAGTGAHAHWPPATRGVPRTAALGRRMQGEWWHRKKEEKKENKRNGHASMGWEKYRRQQTGRSPPAPRG